MARRLVIIGGDAAGKSAASQARRMKSVDELEIIVFERSSRTSYAACGLPYLVGGIVTSPDSLVARTPAQHRAKGIDVRIRHEVTAIDVKASSVTVRDLDRGLESAGHYDELLVGTCASGISPPWPGIDAEGCCNFEPWTTRQRWNDCSSREPDAPWWSVPATSDWKSPKACSNVAFT